MKTIIIWENGETEEFEKIDYLDEPFGHEIELEK